MYNSSSTVIGSLASYGFHMHDLAKNTFCFTSLLVLLRSLLLNLLV